MRRIAATLVWLAGSLPVAAADYQAGAPLEVYEGARADFAFRCKGCHGFAGEGTPGHVPRLDGFVGWFTHLEEGRDYLMRVPGVARSKLDDERLAGVLNWMLETYGGDGVAPGFAPFEADEVGRARRRPLAPHLAATRARLISDLRARGLIGPEADAGLPLDEVHVRGQPDRQIDEP